MLYHCATNYVFINLVEDKQTRVMHVTDWRYEKGKLFQAINLFSLNRMLAAREVMRPKFRVSHCLLQNINIAENKNKRLSLNLF